MAASSMQPGISNSSQIPSPSASLLQSPLQSKNWFNGNVQEPGAFKVASASKLHAVASMHPTQELKSHVDKSKKQSPPWVVVAGELQQTSTHKTCIVVVVGGACVVPWVVDIGAPCNLEFVAHPVAIRVVQAHAITIHKRFVRVDAQRVVWNECLCVEVAGHLVAAAGATFEFARPQFLEFCTRVVVASFHKGATANQA